MNHAPDNIPQDSPDIDLTRQCSYWPVALYRPYVHPSVTLPLSILSISADESVYLVGKVH